MMTGMHIVRNEGILGLYRGLNPAVARGLFYGGDWTAFVSYWQQLHLPAWP